MQDPSSKSGGPPPDTAADIGSHPVRGAVKGAAATSRQRTSNGGFTMLDDSALSADLTPIEKLVYWSIRSFAWERGGEMCTASYGEIGRRCGVSRMTVCRAVPRIAEVGLVDVEPRPSRTCAIYAPRNVRAPRDVATNRIFGEPA